MYELCFCSSVTVRPIGLLKDISKLSRKNSFQSSKMFHNAELHGGQFTIRVGKCDMNSVYSKQ